jgi:hypothetical protein
LRNEEGIEVVGRALLKDQAQRLLPRWRRKVMKVTARKAVTSFFNKAYTPTVASLSRTLKKQPKGLFGQLLNRPGFPWKSLMSQTPPAERVA